MKKFIAFAAVAGMAALASCGNDEAAKKLADSLHQDSIMKAEAAKHAEDSMKMADSINKATAAAEAKRKEDSAKMADSIANAGKKKK